MSWILLRIDYQSNFEVKFHNSGLHLFLLQDSARFKVEQIEIQIITIYTISL